MPFTRQPAPQPPRSLADRSWVGRFAGFTLIELLVVISILALLIGILVPALGMARKCAHAANSLANTRSWGQGTHLFLHDHKFILPWEGEKQDVLANIGQRMWWANSVPKYVGQEPYYYYWKRSVVNGIPVPKPPEKNIFVDPSAQIGAEQLGGTPLNSIGFYFSYAWNADLAEGGIKPGEIDGLERLKFDTIRSPSIAIMMFELRAGTHELDFLVSDDPGYDQAAETDLLRMKGDEQHFAGRHFKGGHLVYADGHAKHRTWLDSFTSDDWAADGSAGD